MPLNGNGWSPHGVTRFIRSLRTAAGTAHVDTDAGEGFIKALGNPEGPHILACEWVGSMLADWLGLPTLDFALINITTADEIPYLRGGNASPGPAFITRYEPKGFPWGGSLPELQSVENRRDLSGLVVVDTWTRNCDRYAPNGERVNLDNVFLIQKTRSKKTVLLKAMDFTHAFTCGRPISRSISYIDTTQDQQVYGLFPEFRRFLDREEISRLAARLSQFTADVAGGFVAQVPQEWDLGDEIRSHWAAMITRRALFVSETMEAKLWPQQKLGEGGTV